MKIFGHDQPWHIEVDAEDLIPQRLQEKIKIAVEEEMCMTVEDYLSRRTRLLLLDAAQAIRVAPLIAELMAGVMNKDQTWKQQQVQDFNLIAKNYLPTIN